MKGNDIVKNSNGTGSVVKRKGVRKPYLVYGAAVLVDGKYKREYLGSFKTKKEAEERRMAYYFNPQIKRTDMTLKEVFEDYKGTHRYKKTSDSSKSVYAASFNRCEKIQNYRFADIRIADMQTIVDKVEAEGKSRALQEQLKNFFNVMYRHAIQNEIVEKNYAQFVEIGLEDKDNKRALTDIEIEKIRQAALKGNTAAKWTMYLIYSGWRISEMLELTVFNYDSEKHSFTGGKKTKSGKNRLVPVHSELQWIIDEQLAKGGETVFCNEKGELMKSNYFRLHYFNPMLKELGIDSSVTPHITRHTFATKLKQAGADEFYRKKLLGHAMQDITDGVYTHAEYDNLRETIELLSPNCTLKNVSNPSSTQKKSSKISV